MKILELYKPKIGKKAADIAKGFFSRRVASNSSYDYDIIWLNERLAKIGWSPLNNGGYSRVYSNPKKKYVLKVNSHEDRAYDKFVLLIKGPRNKHFPIISDRKELAVPVKPMYDDDGDSIANQWNTPPKIYHVYMIEKLEPIPGPYNENYASVLSGLIDIYREEMNPSRDRMLEILTRDYLTQEEIPDAMRFMAENPALVRAAAVLGNATKNTKLGIDMHAGNIMQREDGTVVIIDPYVDWV